MTAALIIVSVVLFLLAIVLTLRIVSFKCGLADIRRQLPEIIQGGTNKLLTVSDSALRALAADLNARISEIRQKELKYENGDMEVKTAIESAAHDIRTPITAVSGYLDLLESETDPAKIQRYLSVIRERTDTLAKLSEELFAYSVTADNYKIRTPETLNAAAVLKECLADCYEAFCSKGIAPQINIPSTPFAIVADKTELSRMFANIISNALKYAVGTFKVQIEGRRITFVNRVENVDAIDVNRLFDRFYTVNNGKTSTGLGLSIAKIICERIGGKISASIADGSLAITVLF